MNGAFWMVSATLEWTVGLGSAVALMLGLLALASRPPPPSAKPTLLETLLERLEVLRQPPLTAPYRPARSSRLRAQRLAEVRRQMHAKQEYLRRQTR